MPQARSPMFGSRKLPHDHPMAVPSHGQQRDSWLRHAYRERDGWPIEPETDSAVEICNALVDAGWLYAVGDRSYRISARGVDKIQGRCT